MLKDADSRIDPHAAVRAATRRDHLRVESNRLMARLMGRGCDAPTLQRVIAAHLSIYRAMEPVLRGQTPDCLRQHTRFRFRTELAEADYAELGGSERLVPDCPATAFRSDAEWIGYLYVVEGASLGGKLITARLKKLDNAVHSDSLNVFCPYGASTGQVWKSFLGVLRARLNTQRDVDLAIQAARATFRMHENLFNAVQETVHEHANGATRH